jgi:hypothetical protein
MKNTTSNQGARRYARVAFVVVATAFAIGVAIQIFIAGLATFVSPLHWVNHATFVRILELLPLFMLLLAFPGRLPGRVKWQSAALLGLIFAQYFTANIVRQLPWVAALHPLLAVVLLWAAARLAMTTWRLVFDREASAGLQPESQAGN